MRLGPIEFLAHNLRDWVRVTREGELRAMSTDVTLVIRGLGPGGPGEAAALTPCCPLYVQRPRQPPSQLTSQGA